MGRFTLTPLGANAIELRVATIACSGSMQLGRAPC